MMRTSNFQCAETGEKDNENEKNIISSIMLYLFSRMCLDE